MKKNKQKKPHQHLIPLFFAVILGVSLSYYAVSLYTHASSAASLSLLQYISPNRTVNPPTYALCPQLEYITDTDANGTSFDLLHDKCTNTYWSKTDATLVHNGETGYTWNQAVTACATPYRLPTPDELLALNNVPCGDFKICANIKGSTQVCQTDNDCGGAPGSCQLQACSPILRTTSGFTQDPLPLFSPGDGAYWASTEQDLDPNLNDPVNSGDKNETGVSVNLKYGIVNNPALGKSIQLNVRCIYNTPDVCPEGQVRQGIKCVTPTN